MQKGNALRLAIFALASLPLWLAAANAADSCQPIADAVGKLATTPTHIYSTIKEGAGGSSATEMILINGVVYGKVGGGWMRTNLTPRDMAASEEMNKPRSGSCRYQKDEAAGSDAASVYIAESASGEAKMQVWISKAKGLILRQEVDTKSNDGSTHMSIRYEYANVQAPKV